MSVLSFRLFSLWYFFSASFFYPVAIHSRFVSHYLSFIGPELQSLILFVLYLYSSFRFFFPSVILFFHSFFYILYINLIIFSFVLKFFIVNISIRQLYSYSTTIKLVFFMYICPVFLCFKFFLNIAIRQ